MNFRSNDVSVFPTAYRQYEDTNSQTQIVDIEARLNTEYNITNLVNGLLDERINSGNFVVDYDSIQHTIKFCLKGYYFEIRNLQGYDNITPLYVKINIEKFNESTYKNLYELVPMSYEAGTNRNLDKLESNQLSFIGLDFVNSETTGYFQLLDGNGDVPEKSWLRFSTRQIGYFNGENWVSINTNFSTTTLQATNISTNNFSSPNIIEDTSSSFKVKNINNSNQSYLGIIVDTNGKIVSKDQHNTVNCTTGAFDFISAVTTDNTGKLFSATTKTIPTDTSDFTDSNEVIPTSKLVRTKLSDEATTRANNDATLQTNINNEATTRANADTTLQNNINSEASTRANSDSTLQTNINNEASARANADTTLQTNINSEASTRETNDNALSGRIDTNANNITDKISKSELVFAYSNGTLTITKSYSQ